MKRDDMSKEIASEVEPYSTISLKMFYYHKSDKQHLELQT